LLTSVPYLIAAFALGATLILRGAETSLRLVIERPGADVVVVPEGEQNIQLYGY
jgi:hypothetical protein